MAAAFNKINWFVRDLAQKVHNLNTASDALMVCLTNTLPVANDSLLANVTQVAAGNGYVTNGAAVTISSGTQTAGTFKLVCANVVFTAAGGTIGPFRYAVLYNSTPTTPLKPLIGWYDYGSAVTLNDTETFTVGFDQTNGVFTLA